MLKWWIYVLIGIFLIDFIYRTFFETKINLKSLKSKIIPNSYKDNDVNLNISKSEIKNNNPVNYDKQKFDPEIIHFYSKQKFKKFEQNGYEEDDDEIVYPENYNHKKILIDEDEIEFEGLIPKPQKRLNITIEYDDKYQSLYDELSKQLDGNITYLTFYPKKTAIEGGQKILRNFLYFTMCICCICFAFIEKIISFCCSNIPEGLKSFISIIKFLLSGGSYLFHMYFIKKISQTNMFEVYVEQKLRYSTLKKEEPPNYVILFNIIKKIKNDE